MISVLDAAEQTSIAKMVFGIVTNAEKNGDLIFIGG
jgi:hypothetical protein